MKITLEISDDQLIALRRLFQELPEATTVMPINTKKGICIPFTLGDRNYEAVGFLEAGESSVDGDTMLARTADKNGGAVGEEDWKFIGEHRTELPTELERFYLVTDRRGRGDPRGVSFFIRDGSAWNEGWHSLGYRWFDDALVVRRRT